MNKSDLVESLAVKADISKAAAVRALDAVIDSIADGLTKDQIVSLVGFGTFAVSERKARTGRNPQTGETMNIPASKVLRFKPGKTLKDKVNQ